MAAARHHQVPPEELAYRLLDKRHGFVRIRRPVVIEVDPEAPRRAAPVPAVPPAAGGRETGKETRARPPAPRAPAPVSRQREGPAVPAGPPVPREEAVPSATGRTREVGAPEEEGSPEDRPPAAAAGGPAAAPRQITARGAEAAAYRQALVLLLDLAALDLDGEVAFDDERIQVELRGADEERLVKPEGRPLLAVEHLLPRVAGPGGGRFLPCHVDSRGYREMRENELQELARRMAGLVRSEGRPRTLPPMNPAERRIIHLAVGDEQGVTSESEGTGYMKRVVIRVLQGY